MSDSVPVRDMLKHSMRRGCELGSSSISTRFCCEGSVLRCRDWTKAPCWVDPRSLRWVFSMKAFASSSVSRKNMDDVLGLIAVKRL